MDEVTCREAVILSKHLSGFNKEFNQLYCIAIDGAGRKQLEGEIGEFAEIVSDLDIHINDEVRMHIFPTAHEQYRNGDEKEFFKHTFGCVFECSNESDKRLIGYTSDTSLQKECYQRMRELFQRCQVLIANISGIYEKDIMLQEAKERHLGYYGCYQIISDLMAEDENCLRYFLLSEFSNQISDIRFDVSRYLQEEITELATRNGKESPSVIPTEIALTLDLEQLKIRCSSCHSYADRVSILKPCGENEKLQYICSKCKYEVG